MTRAGAAPRFATAAIRLGTENAFTVLDDIAACRRRGLDVVELNIGEPDFATAPPVVAAAVAHLEAGNTHYCDPAGILPLREAVARQVGVSRGLEVTPDRVIVTPGAKPTIAATFLAHVEPGDEVVYPTPGFPIYESWAEYVGAHPVPVPLHAENGFTVGAGQLRAAITDRTKLVVLNSPSNPTGGAFTSDQAESVAEVIAAQAAPGLRVYSDEVYEHLLFDGAAHHSAASFAGLHERTIIASGHSKTHAMTGWRLGYAVLPTAEEAEFFRRLNINTFSCVPPFIQEAGIAAIEDPDAATAAAAMAQELQQRRDWVVAALNEIDGIACTKPRGAFYAYPDVTGVCERLGIFAAHEKLPSPARRSPSGLLQMFLLYRHGVATIDRESFGRIGAEGQHHLRLSFGSDPAELRRGVERIAAACHDADGFAEFFAAEGSLLA